MSRSIYDKQLVQWVKSHHWDSLEKDKDIILRHIRTFAGGNVEQENAEALKPSHNTGSPKLPEWKEIRNALPPAPADWGCDEETSVEIFEYGAQSAYDLIVRQLRAGA